MDTEDSPLISTGMPGCPYRMTSYTGTALVDADATYGLQLHHPRFLEFIGAPESARLLNHCCRSVLKFCYPAPRSPNRVRKGHSQDMPAEGSIFDVSPGLPGFNMRPAGGDLQPPEITQPPP